MSDWSDTPPAPFGVSYFNSIFGIHSIGAASGSMGSIASAVYPAANLAIFVPFRLLVPTRVKKLFANNGTVVSGNLDLGIYDSAGCRLTSTGSTAQAGTDTLQTIALETAIRLGAGQFYLAVALNNVTGTLYRVAISFQGRPFGTAQQTSAFALPATATFAQFVYNYLPLIGFVSEEG